jgi:hypothetical protein
MANGARAAIGFGSFYAAPRQLDEFRFGQKATSGQYPRALVCASLSFDGLEQTAHLGSQQVNHNMGSLAAKDSTPRAPSFLSGEVAGFMNTPSAQ